MCCRRQRIKREEAEYAYSGGSGSSYGRGWPKEEAEKEAAPEESVYATVAEVDMYRETGVNPSVSSAGEPTEPHAILDKGKLNRNPTIRAKGGASLERFAYEGPASTKIASSVDDIAVVEVHQSFDFEPAIQTKEHQHDTDCLRNFGYTGVVKDADNPYCTSCQIQRPPRRKEKGRGYDNNISVRKQRR